MAYSEQLKERIEKVLQSKRTAFEGKKFMGGYCFFVDDKMCVGLDIDKKTKKDRLMARIGDENLGKAILKIGYRPMDITGRPLKGFAFIDPDGFDMDKDLEYWIELCLKHNPKANRSKRK